MRRGEVSRWAALLRSRCLGTTAIGESRADRLANLAELDVFNAAMVRGGCPCSWCAYRRAQARRLTVGAEVVEGCER